MFSRQKKLAPEENFFSTRNHFSKALCYEVKFLNKGKQYLLLIKILMQMLNVLLNLLKNLFSEMVRLFNDEYYIFQQNGVNSHIAIATNKKCS